MLVGCASWGLPFAFMVWRACNSSGCAWLRWAVASLLSQACGDGGICVSVHAGVVVAFFSRVVRGLVACVHVVVGGE